MATAMDEQVGSTYSAEFVVKEQDTATALGSGAVAVLATPRVIAWLEHVTVSCLRLAHTDTSVGARIDVRHLRPSPVGATVRCLAEVAGADGPRLTFDVKAVNLDSHGNEADVVATGQVERVVVDYQKFMARLQRD